MVEILSRIHISHDFRKNKEKARTDVRLPLKSSANGQKCFSFRGAKCWNSLSTEAKQASSIKAFKCQIQPKS